MRFFTREWLSGELSGEEEDERVRRYREEHLPTILPKLPHALAELTRGLSDAGEHLVIHDARIRRVLLELGSGRVTLELRTSSSVQGYADLDLEFRGVDLARLDRTLLRRVARKAHTELLYDEVDLEPDGRFAYRVLLWPTRATLEIVFRDFAWRRKAQPDGSFPRAPDPYLERP